MNNKFNRIEVDIKEQGYLIMVSVSNRTTGVGVSYVLQKSGDEKFDNAEIRRVVKVGQSAVGAD